MDFGALPPEIISARMYSGPGSAPMLAAAAAWDLLSATAARATLVGKLSMPQCWTTAAQVANPAGVTFAGGGWTSAVPTAPEAVPAAMPGIPGMPATAAHGLGHGPRYGFRVTVRPRPPAAA